jgi:uncharacterized DUF497 family protein
MLRFTWDERKNYANRRKHGVSFEAAAIAFNDPFVIFDQDRDVGGEPRWQAIGRMAGQALLVVAHIYEEEDGNETIRIVSARRAAAEERQTYFRQFDPGSHVR